MRHISREIAIQSRKNRKVMAQRPFFFFSSHVEVLVSDSLDSSTIKTTHFKGSEDESGDLRELKDRRGDAGPFSFFFPSLKISREKTRRKKTGGGERERRSHLKAKNTQTQSAWQVCWCAEMSWFGSWQNCCLRAFISSYDSGRTRGRRNGKETHTETERERKKTKNRTQTEMESVSAGRWRTASPF